MMNARKFSGPSQCLLILAALPRLLHAQTAVALSTSPNPSRFGAPVVLGATVTPASATGRVTFYDGVIVLGTKPVASGAASLSTILLPAGNRKLKAYYSGDASNAAATSNVISQSVNAQPSASFVAAEIQGTTPGTALLAIADFNGDGNADLLVNNYPSVSTLLGDGAGHYVAASGLTSAGPIIAAAVGDFNGDGIPDIANSASGSAMVTVALGKGDGTFLPPSSYPVPDSPFSLAVGDFNGDGRADIVAADSGSGVDILLGKGDGTFQPAVSYRTNPSAGPQAIQVFVADFNGDGKADLATVNETTATMSILLGVGDGTFQPPSIIALPSAGRYFAVGDFNGDGKPDIASADAAGGVEILLGNGDGTFQKPVASAYGSFSTTGVTVGDFNGDGNIDLALTSFAGLNILLGKGDGTFQPGASAVVFAPGTALVGDFNNDGKTDLAVSSANGAILLLGTTVTVTPTAGTPQSVTITKPFPTPLQVTVKDGANPLSGVTVTFSASAFLPSPNSPGATLSSTTAITDANGVASVTATADSVAGSYGVTATALGVSAQFSLTNLAPVTSVLTVSPTQQSALVSSAFPKPLQVTATDSSGIPVSGVPVTFTAPASRASAVLSAGTATTNASGVASVTATANKIPGNYQVTATTGGISATFSLTNVQPATTPVTLQSSSNPSNFGSPVTLAVTVTSASAPGRVTFFDGVAILGTKPAASGVVSSFSVLLSAGTHKLTAYYRDEANAIVGTSNVLTQTVKATAVGGFLPQSPLLVSPTSVAVGDFNGDGNVDLAFSSGTVLLGKGDGTFQAPVNYPLGAGPIVVGDFNGDGIADLAIASIGGSYPAQVVTATIVLGNGDGTFGSANSYLAATVPLSLRPFSGPLDMAVGDFNGDGKADIVIAFSAQPSPELSPISSVNLLLGNGDGTFSAPISYSGLGPHLGMADFNGDGKPDLVGQIPFGPSASGPGGANAYIVLGNGDGTAQAPINLNLGDITGSNFVAGDFNGDGRTDLAVGGFVAGASGNVSTTRILLGNGDGTFQPAVSYPFGQAVTSGDFNGDGIIDLVVVNAARNTSILYGKGDGTFTQGPSFPGSPLAVTDFNGDGLPDILTANSTNGTVTVLLGAVSGPLTITATGGATQSTFLGSPFASPLGVTVLSNGMPVSGATVTFAAPANGPSAVLSSLTAVTNAAGVASVTATANNIAGGYSVTASVGVASTSFALTNLPEGFPLPNLALGKTATQSSTLAGYPTDAAQSAVDGNTDGAFFDGSVTATNLETNPWWQVDLGATASVTSIVIWNRTDVCCVSRLSDYWVFVSNTPFLATDTPTTLQNRAGTFSFHQTLAATPSATIVPALSLFTQGRYVRVQLSGANYLSLAEVQVFGFGVAPTPTNIAQGKIATQSSTFPGYATDGASSAVDGNTDGNFGDSSVTATNADPNAWWQVDLGASASVSSIVVWNRTDCCSDRLGDYWVFVSDTPFLSTDTPLTLQNRAGTFASHQTAPPTPSATISAAAQGRYVRVQLTGTNYLSLAEVQVFGTGGTSPPANLAQGKSASQSSTFPGYTTDGASAAVDGNTDGNFSDGSVTATNLDPNAWWQVDLGASAAVSSVVIWNRTDCCGTRLNDFWVFISDTPFLATDTPTTLQSRPGTFSSHQTAVPNPSTTIAAGAQGRYVRVQLSSPNYLSLAEVQVFGQ